MFCSHLRAYQHLPWTFLLYPSYYTTNIVSSSILWMWSVKIAFFALGLSQPETQVGQASFPVDKIKWIFNQLWSNCAYNDTHVSSIVDIVEVLESLLLLVVSLLDACRHLALKDIVMEPHTWSSMRINYVDKKTSIDWYHYICLFKTAFNH